MSLCRCGEANRAPLQPARSSRRISSASSSRPAATSALDCRSASCNFARSSSSSQSPGSSARSSTSVPSGSSVGSSSTRRPFRTCAFIVMSSSVARDRPPNKRLLLAAPVSEAAGSLCSHGVHHRGRLHADGKGVPAGHAEHGAREADPGGSGTRSAEGATRRVSGRANGATSIAAGPFTSMSNPALPRPADAADALRDQTRVLRDLVDAPGDLRRRLHLLARRV